MYPVKTARPKSQTSNAFAKFGSPAQLTSASLKRAMRFVNGRIPRASSPEKIKVSRLVSSDSIVAAFCVSIVSEIGRFLSRINQFQASFFHGLVEHTVEHVAALSSQPPRRKFVLHRDLVPCRRTIARFRIVTQASAKSAPPVPISSKTAAISGSNPTLPTKSLSSSP